MHFLDDKKTIEEWFEAQWLKIQPPLYGSIDIRSNTHKIAPVDMNCFPAGFNNLNKVAATHAVNSFKNYINHHYPKAKKIGLIGESHTRNLFYLENLATIAELASKAGFTVFVSTLNDPEKREILLPSGQILCLCPFDALETDLIILNNDLSDGIPLSLTNATKPIIPDLKYAWTARLKSNHFKYYQKTARAFSKMLNIDPWLIDAYYNHCPNIDFLKREGVSCLANHVEILLNKIQTKYDEHQITAKPFVVIKADNGTYGMSVMMVDSPSAVYTLNRKQRTKMSAGKGGHAVSRVIIQEGVYSNQTVQDKTAEPVIYAVGKEVVGGFYRIHPQKKANENLNSPGMYFEPIENINTHAHYDQTVIARLSLLAAAQEQ